MADSEIKYFFVRRPIFAGVISIVIIIVGLLSLRALPVARYPEIAPPTIQVSTVYPGADALTIAETVAAVIEREVNGVENMIYMSSVNSSDGTMSLSVVFETGTDLDMANVLVQNRVSAAEPRLPEEVKRQGVKVKKRSSETTLFISFYSPDGRYDDLFLSNFVALRVRDDLARINGVGDVQAFGAGDYSMRIWMDPDKLKSRRLTAGDVIQAIREQNVQVAAGKIGERPVPEGQAFEYVINTRGRLVDAEEFGKIIIRAETGGRVVRVNDVARVEVGSQSYTFMSQFNGQDSATLAVYQIPGANAIDVAEGVQAKLVELSRGFPPGLEYKVAYDATEVIRASIREVVSTLIIALILVVLTVYVFLQNVRATLIPSITIPVSLIGTFAAMLAMDFSINQLTLFGLVLVIGIVVDDAIVVVENTTRHIEETGLPPKQAADRAIREVIGPVIATTLVLLAVFIPTAFMGGITGQLFRQFAVTISIATIFSSINALTLSPALCGVLLRKSAPKERGVFKLFNDGLAKTTTKYSGIVRMAIRRSVIGVILFLALATLAMMGLGGLPSAFVPQEDEGWCIINVQLPDAASLERTKEVVDRINEAISDVPGIRDFLGITGYSLLDGAAGPNNAFLIAVFENWDERGPEESQDAIIRNISVKLAEIQDAIAFAIAPPSLPGVGVSGGFTMQLQDRGGAGLTALQQMAQEFIEDANTQSGLTGVKTTFRANVPQLYVNIDRDQVKSKKLSLGDVFEALSAYLGSAYVNDFTMFGRVFQVKAQAEGSYRSEPRDISRLEVRNREGQMIPLSAVAEVEKMLGPTSVFRHNVYPSIKILGGAGEGYSSGDALALVEDMAERKLPPSMGFEWTELSFQEKKAAAGVTMIFVLAVVLVYLVLAAQYESWTVPLSVVLAVPTALLGAVIGIMIRGMDNNVYTQIGIVLLIGLSTKSAILIVEFAKSERDSGKDLVEAAVGAAQLRFRAVLMTAFSFILGVIPLLVSSGAGAESQKVIGTAVFGGMIVATIVSVIAVPMLFYVIQRLSERAQARST